MCSEIERYHDRFRNLLGPGNRRYIQTLIVLTHAFLHTLLDDIGSASNSSMAINDFLFSLNIDNINLVKLVRYIKESNIVNKVKAQSYLFIYLSTSLSYYIVLFSYIFSLLICC